MNNFANFTMERVTQPEFEVFELAEMKRHLRVYQNVTDRDDEVTDLIKASREWCEDFTGRALTEQRWRINFGDGVLIDTVREGYCGPITWPAANRGIYLRRSPVTEIISFKSVGSDGVETTIDEDSYQLRDGASKWPRIISLSGTPWMTGTYRVEFTAGFDEDDGVPARYKQAMKLWAEANFDRDEKMMPLLILQAENMMRPERCYVSLA